MKSLSPNVLIQNRYLIVHLIGKGGMGEVYLAVDQRLGSAVALKRTFFSDDELLANAFEREARILANLRHPILPKVSDHFVEGENQFLVMEHITGDDLSKRLEKTKQAFPLSWVLFWADQLLDALHYLHTHEPPIIHRDIKPQNLKLTNDNHIVLLDFGLSKNSVGETRTSSSGSVVGYTPHYAPMEQIRGTGTNAQSDLYSLSATVYQLITNLIPPDALTRADSLLSGLPDPIKPIHEINKEVSEEVSDVIIAGMDIRQDSRHPSARDMQKKLRDAYARLQNAMSAQTIAFSIGDQEQKNKNLDGGLPSDPLPEVVSDSDELAVEAAQRFNNVDSNSEVPQAHEFETSDVSQEVKPSDVKTEVLLAGSYPAINAAQEGREISVDEDIRYDDDVEPASFETADDFDVEESFEADGKGNDGQSFTPQETVSLNSQDEVDFDGEDDAFEGVGGHGETAFFSSIEVDEGQGSGATFVAEAEASENDGFASIPAPAPQPKKSGSGKKIAVAVGLLAVLFIFVGVIGGVGWFMLRGNPFSAQETPVPTPEATVETTPTAKPTVDETLVNINTNVNTAQSNINSNVKIVSSNVNTKTAGTVTQPTVRPTQQTVRPVVTPPPIVKPVVKPTETPKKTPTPGILQ